MTAEIERIAELEAEVARLRADRDALAQALAEAEVYRTAIQNAPVGVMCISMTSGRYLFSNSAHGALLGFTPQEIMSGDPYRRWVEITHPEDFERERVEHERLSRGEISSFESDRRCIRKNGEVRWLHVWAVGVRNAEGRLTHLYVYMVDMQEHRVAIEARERLEEQLRQSQKLEALGRLAGGVAHDFNNRLMIIMGHAEVLKNAQPPDSSGAHHASTVIASAKRAAELTQQLLAFSRRQVLKPRAFDMNATVGAMRQVLERLLGENIELSTDLAAKHLVFSDPGQIEQVILNLAINARDAMPHGGRLRLETRDVFFDSAPEPALPPGDYVALIVTDTGMGISEQVLPRIFEPFFTTKDVGSGTGLGLAMVEGIVQQSSGCIRVESRTGEGTAFSVYLPRAPTLEAVERTPHRDAPEQFRGFETILLCDDDDGVREILVNVLALRAYTVLEASNAQQALELAGGYPGAIDLLITDLVMPGLSGTELAAKLRETQPELEVLYVSGYTDNQALLSGTVDRRAHFLPKPFLPGEFARTVHAILTRGGTAKLERPGAGADRSLG